MPKEQYLSSRRALTLAKLGCRGVTKYTMVSPVRGDSTAVGMGVGKGFFTKRIVLTPYFSRKKPVGQLTYGTLVDELTTPRYVDEVKETLARNAEAARALREKHEREFNDDADYIHHLTQEEISWARENPVYRHKWLLLMSPEHILWLRDNWDITPWIHYNAYTTVDKLLAGFFQQEDGA